MNNKANKRLFALAHPDGCDHEFEEYRAMHGNHNCLKGCGMHRFEDTFNRDYFDPDIPHSEIVRLVTAAVEKHGARFQMAMFRARGNKEWAGCLTLTAPQIAAAIFELEKENGK